MPARQEGYGPIRPRIGLAFAIRSPVTVACGGRRANGVGLADAAGRLVLSQLRGSASTSSDDDRFREVKPARKGIVSQPRAREAGGQRGRSQVTGALLNSGRILEFVGCCREVSRSSRERHCTVQKKIVSQAARQAAGQPAPRHRRNCTNLPNV